jgi:hypothetical protein
MLTSATKRLILPFSNQKSRESEVEAAAIFTVAEQNRSRGGGLIARQSQETLSFIARIEYPLWLYPKNNTALIFDGLDGYSHSLSYGEAPSAAAFMSSLQTCQTPRETYLTFLCDHSGYFLQPSKTKQFTLRGLIANIDFRAEFSLYRKEATEFTTSSAMLLPLLEAQTISATLSELDKLLAYQVEDAAKLFECLRLMKKTTNQYVIEIDYEAVAAKEEADAKIKAQQEFINPQIAKLNKEYSRKIKDLTESFDKELESLQKIKAKTEKFINAAESDVKEYERNEKAASKKGHEAYAKRWKEKIKLAEKEIAGLKKELKNIERNSGRISKQKVADLSRLTFELDAELKLTRQPIVELEAAREEKTLEYKLESNRLVACEKPIVEGIDRSIRLREADSTIFDGLGISEQQLKSPAWVYVPFYIVCYEAGMTKRYLCIPPSIISTFDFSAKLKGAFGVSKTKNLLTPRFRTIAALIAKVETLTRQNTAFEGQLWSIGEKNNLLKNNVFCLKAQRGLVTLRQSDWLSERESSELSRRLPAK